MKINKMIALCLALLPGVMMAQTEKKPTLMIVPSDNWCTMRYFTQTFDNQGMKVRVPDYQRAFQEDAELREVIAKVGQYMTEYGFSLKDCEQELKAIANRQAEDNVTMSKTSGASLVESPLDQLKRRAKADIIVRQQGRQRQGRNLHSRGVRHIQQQARCHSHRHRQAGQRRAAKDA